MFNTPNPFGQPSSNPFGSQSGFPQINNASTNPFAPKPFGSTSPFGSQTGTSIFGGTSTGVFGAPQATSPFSSTTTFGAPSSSAFGNTISAFGASSTPAFGSSSSAFGGSSVFGQKPVFGGFGSSPTQTSPFGSTGQQSQAAFGSSLFGSSSPFGATSQSPFGSTSTPAFGSTSIPGFGATSAPAFGSASTPVFGATSSPAFGAASTPVFGATSSPAFGAASTPAFGSTSTLPFGSTGSAFGASSAPAFGSGGAFGASNSPVFGSPSTSAFGVSNTPAFGASTSAFGASSSPVFGASSTPSFSFGSSSAFGQSTSAFGSNVFGSTSTPFGTQSSAFGSQSTTPTFASTTFGQQPFGGQRGGTRIAAYTPTTEPDSGSGSQGAGKLESISAMPIYKDKCHEELRWEDYQLGDKGGLLPAGQTTAPVGFNATPSQTNLLTPTFGQAPATFGQTPANPFSTPTTSNPFAPKAAFPPSTFSFSSSAFAPSTSSNLFGSTVSPSTSSFITTSAAPFGSSPSFFNSSSTTAFGSQPAFGSANTAGSMPSFGSSINFGNTQPSSLFPSTTPTLGLTGSAFRPSNSAFGNSTASFSQPSLFNQPSSVFGGNLFSSTPSLMPSSTPAFGQSPSTLSTPFQPAQTQPIGAFGFGNFGQAQPGGISGVGGTSSIFGPNGFGNLSANHTSAVAQPPPVTNPFGTLPGMPHMTIGRAGNASLIQYGISSMPVVDQPSPLKISSLLTSRPLSQRRIRLSARKYHPKNDGLKVPFFSEDEETPSTPKADALFIPRENPRALVIRPTEHWPAKASAEKASLTKNTSGLRVNGKNTEETSLQSDSSIRDENGNSAKDGPEKEPDQHNIVNQNTNGFHEHNNNQKGETYKTLSGHRAGEAAIAYEHGADIEALMPKLRHADYYTEPKIQELAAKERAEPGFCRHVKDFVVGRHGFGSIKFMGETDVRRIDLESLVQFNNREVIVYMDDSKKPPVGQGLNKPAEVTLLNIKCFDKKTGRQYTEGLKVEKYKEMLKRKAEDQGAEFVSYDSVKGEWKFKVNHFSKYNLEDEDEFGEWQ